MKLLPFVLVLVVCSLPSCTKEQRSIVRTVVDIVDQVCGDKDSVDDCLGKAQAMRSSQRAAAEAQGADAGTDGGK